MFTASDASLGFGNMGPQDARDVTVMGDLVTVKQENVWQKTPKLLAAPPARSSIVINVSGT